MFKPNYMFALYRLEMNSSLEQDYDEFKFSRENQLEETNVEENLQNFSELFHVCLNN